MTQGQVCIIIAMHVIIKAEHLRQFFILKNFHLVTLFSFFSRCVSVRLYAHACVWRSNSNKIKWNMNDGKAIEHWKQLWTYNMV